MLVKSINFTNWRNITSCSVDFSGGVNVLWGMNAQGKSNILEGIYYFARGKSFRGAHDRELINFAGDFAMSSLEFLRDGYEAPTSLDVTIPTAGRKRVHKNSSSLTSIAEMMGVFRAVLFSPRDMTIVTGGPSERRTFLDVALSQLSETYLTYIRRYAKILAERNALLKRKAEGLPVSADEFSVYAEAMSEAAGVICAYRADYVSLLNDEVVKYFSEMTKGGEIPSLIYTSHALYDGIMRPLSGKFSLPEKVLYNKLTSSLEREAAAGSSLWGIHKDDVQLKLNGNDARLYGSQGQQRSMALAIKIGEAEIGNRLGGEYPVILLDDVFSELDDKRRSFILDSLSDADEGRQIIITSCEPDVIPREKLSHVTFRHVVNGNVTD